MYTPMEPSTSMGTNFNEMGNHKKDKDKEELDRQHKLHSVSSCGGRHAPHANRPENNHPVCKRAPICCAVTPWPTGKTKTSSTLMPSKPSEPGKSISLSKRPVFLTMALFINFFVLKLKLPVEETKMSNSDMTPGHLQCTPAGRRGSHLRQRTHEHQNQRRARNRNNLSGSSWACLVTMTTP